MNFEKGQQVYHSKYGIGTVDSVYEYEKAILIDLESEDGIIRFNQDRLKPNMPNTDCLERVYEDDLSLVTVI